MKVKSYIRLQLKAIQRDNESLFLVTFLIAILAGVVGYFGSKSIVQQIADTPFTYDLGFIFTCYGYLFSDYMLKLLWKQNFILHSIVKCMPESNRLYMPYYLIKESTSIWNLYLPVLLFFPVFRVMYPLYGLAIAVMLLAGIFLLTLLISNVVIYLNIGTNKILYSIFFFLLLSLILFLFCASFLSYKAWLLGIVTLFLAGLNIIFVTGNVKRMKYYSGQENKSRFLVFRNKIPFFKRSSKFFKRNVVSLQLRLC